MQTEVSATSYSLPYFPICYVLTSPLTHKSNTVELNRIYLPRVYWWGSGRGSDRRPERRREGWEMMRRSIGPWAVTPLARFHIHLHPSSLHPSGDWHHPSFLWQARQILQAWLFRARNNPIECGINDKLWSAICSRSGSHCTLTTGSPNRWPPNRHGLTTNLVRYAKAPGQGGQVKLACVKA